VCLRERGLREREERYSVRASERDTGIEHRDRHRDRQTRTQHTCTHAHTHTRHKTHACTHAHTQKHTHTHMRKKHTRARARARARAHTHTHKQTNTHIDLAANRQRGRLSALLLYFIGNVLPCLFSHSLSLSDAFGHQCSFSSLPGRLSFCLTLRLRHHVQRGYLQHFGHERESGVAGLQRV
jgi:hypothetical protein